MTDYNFHYCCFYLLLFYYNYHYIFETSYLLIQNKFFVVYLTKVAKLSEIAIHFASTQSLDRIWVGKGIWVFIIIGEPVTLLNLIYKHQRQHYMS